MPLILETFTDANVLHIYNTLPASKQQNILDTIIAQNTDAKLTKAIIQQIDLLSKL